MRSTLRTSRLLTLLLSGLLAFGATACSPKGDANSSQNDGVAQQGKSKPQDVDGVDQDINTENPNEGAAGQVTTGGKDGSGTPTENGGTPGDEAGADQTGGGSTSGG
ncbi:hypothetical protein, partial [Deinococcus pimensis]|uniref:hypothetical protein n=1 Tax=Deinococcus pimensis TaxID=309888 RepID=UPI00048951FA